MRDEVDDFESLYIHSDDVPTTRVETTVARRNAARKKRTFIKIPLEWSHRLSHTKHAYTRAVLDCLLLLAWRGGAVSVVLSNLALRDWGVPPREKSRALAELEELRLITTERCKGKSPRITLLIEPGPVSPR